MNLDCIRPKEISTSSELDFLQEESFIRNARSSAQAGHWDVESICRGVASTVEFHLALIQNVRSGWKLAPIGRYSNGSTM
jgi:ribose 1,5-bisphosphokinase PhnN